MTRADPTGGDRVTSRQAVLAAALMLAGSQVGSAMAQSAPAPIAAPNTASNARQATSGNASGSAKGAGGGDIPAQFKPDLSEYDYDKREIMIPMRDGARLHAVIVVPRSVKHGPIMLDRTPYSANKLTGKVESPLVAETMRYVFRDLVEDGYIVAVEDVRGKYKSDGDYVMNRPLIGPLNDTKVDHSTDAYDTISWLVKNVPESNGRVGTIGTSYDGFTTLMSLINPNPALKAAVPINPMVDTWMGDDWFHHGAFREEMMGYIYSQTATKDSSKAWWATGHDDFPLYMDHVSAAAFGRSMGMEQLPFWRRLTEHPAYDAFWQGQAVDRLLARAPLTVPTLFVQGQWDQEDIYGAVAAYEATRAKGDAANRFLVIGPWYHGQANSKAASLGPFDWDQDTAAWFRKHVMLPFLDARLKDRGAPATIAPVTAFQTGTDTWRTYATWPQACAACAYQGRALYLRPGSALSFSAPAAGDAAYDEYVSDPAKPVPYRLRPIRPTYADDSTWHSWLVDDQRFADGRPDVLSYSTPPLTTPVSITGAPVAHLMASTTGTDADWVVKLIDVYPDTVPDQPALGGYELGVSMDILRGRYRDDPAQPSAIPAGKVVGYSLALPNVNHVFLPGHRIMVQIQSSWFPLYDRNPQSTVPNIFFSKPGDYIKATIRMFHARDSASYVQLPIVPSDDGTVIAAP